MEKIKLEKLFPMEEILNGYGVFTFLTEYSGQQPLYPLVESFIDSNNCAYLDNDYHIGFSAEKYISPLLYKLWEKSLFINGYSWEDFYNDEFNIEDVISTLFGNLHLGYIIYERFGVKWKKIYDALVNSQYNPLNNYDMEEKRTPNLTHTETYNNVTDTRTPNLTTSGNANSKTGVYGFNGTSAKDSAQNDGTSSESVTGTDTNVKTGNTTNTETGTDTLTRKGNIGVTSSQQLIESEWELRKHDFYAMIYKDIDSILCLKIY